jgi:hypothetical protein
MKKDDSREEFFGLRKEVAEARENGNYTEEHRNTLCQVWLEWLGLNQSEWDKLTMQ